MYVNAVGVPKARQLGPVLSVPHGTLTRRGLGDLSSSLASLTAPSSLPTWGIAALVLGALYLGPKLSHAAGSTKRGAKKHKGKLGLIAAVGAAGFAGYYFGKQGGFSSL